MTGQGFKYKVSLTKVETNETVEFEDTWDYPSYIRTDTWEYDPVFIWSDGNYACDCNRSLFFERALKNLPIQKAITSDEVDIGCSNNKFKVNWIINLETGNKIYEGDDMADNLAPVKINDSPSKSIANADQQTQQWRQGGSTAADAVKNNFNKNPVNPESLK